VALDAVTAAIVAALTDAHADTTLNGVGARLLEVVDDRLRGAPQHEHARRIAEALR
jgi:hypothetical protein